MPRTAFGIFLGEKGAGIRHVVGCDGHGLVAELVESSPQAETSTAMNTAKRIADQ